MREATMDSTDNQPAPNSDQDKIESNLKINRKVNILHSENSNQNGSKEAPQGQDRT